MACWSPGAAQINVLQRRTQRANTGSLRERRTAGKRGGVARHFPHWKFEQRSVDLLAGDRILLFTDGITETENSRGEEFGEESLISAMHQLHSLSADEIQTRILGVVIAFCEGTFRDDATPLVLAVL